MSTDYMYTIKRKADSKKIAKFYFNWIKNLYDIDCKGIKLDPEDIRYGDEGPKTRYEMSDIENDIKTLDERAKQIWQKIFEKKLLVPLSASKDIKDDIESDIYMLEQDYDNVQHAVKALAGLRAVVTALVEDLVKDGSEEDYDSRMAYVYNAEGLQAKDGMEAAHIWTDDVYIEAEAH